MFRSKGITVDKVSAFTAFISPRNKEAKGASIWICANCDKCCRATTRLLWHSQQSPRKACGLRPEGGEWAEERRGKNKQTRWKQRPVSKLWGPAGPNQAAVLGLQRSWEGAWVGAWVYSERMEAIERFQQGGSMTDSQCWGLFLIVVVYTHKHLHTHTYTHTHSHTHTHTRVQVKLLKSTLWIAPLSISWFDTIWSLCKTLPLGETGR